MLETAQKVVPRIVEELSGGSRINLFVKR